jgi:KDO2-lipid IV(A) lauroyltransferase
MLLYLLAIIIRFLAPRVPDRLLYPVAITVASALYVVWPEARRNAKENMRRVLGPGATKREVNRAARRAFRNLGRYGADFVRAHRRLEGKVAFTGWENIDKVLEEGKGAILVSLHMGSWELGAMTVASRRYPLNVVVDKVYNERFSQWVQRMRTKFGMKVIAVKEGMPQLLKTLRRNEVVAILMDAPRLANIKVRFCGSQAKVPGGPAALALRTGAKIIPATFLRVPGNRFQGHFLEPLHFEPSGDFSRDVQELSQRIMDTLEQVVKRYPEQWFMFRHMWIQGPEERLT